MSVFKRVSLSVSMSVFSSVFKSAKCVSFFPAVCVRILHANSDLSF